MSAHLPADPTQRQSALKREQLLEAAPEQAFDDLTLLAAHICQVPMALVSLLDGKRQWFKSRVRVEDTWTPRDLAFFADIICRAGDVIEIPDTRADARFADSPVVAKGPQIRFCAGVPLVTPEGHALGALCVMDRLPRNLTPDQGDALRALSRRVIAQLELRRKTAELTKALAEHERDGVMLRRNIEQLAAAEKRTAQLLDAAEKSRRALLSVLEDEKQTGQNLRESEERFRQITESIDEMFYMTDPDGGALLYISPAYEKIWGRTRASLLQAPEKWANAIHPEDRERVVALAAVKDQQGYHEENYRIIRPDGSIRWILDRSFPVKNTAGKVHRLVGVAQDVTEKKLLETQFFRAQRLESIGTLASGIAHDLNNILAPIMMAGPLIRLSKTPETTEKMLVTIESSAQRGAQLVRQLLTFGRGAEGEKQILSLAPIITEILAMAGQTFPKNITLVANIAAEISPILGDATQVHQVLLNLCVNGRDAMPQGGTLTVAAENIHFDLTSAALTPGAKAGDYAVVKVTDTGTGMSPEIIDKIFDPFFTTKEAGKGTGLGLATVLGLVKSHGGFVTLSSQPGHGSTFRVHFPVALKQEAPAPVVRAGVTPMGRGELILLVDDEANIRDAVSRTLTYHGYTVIVAPDGIEGIAAYAMGQGEIKLVVTDLDMPNMDGVTMIQALKQINPKLKVIVSSGILSRKQMGSRTAELTALGINAFLGKPYMTDQILRAVHDALAG